MASARAQKRLLDALERQHGPRVRQAFERAVREWKGRINVADLIRMIEARDIAGALAVIDVGSAVFRDLEVELADVFEKAGRAMTNLFPRNVRDPRGIRVTFRFDMRNPRAEMLLKRHSSDLVTQIADDARESLRRTLADTFSRGLNPRRAVGEIVGYLNPATGRRQGGILGLSGPQADYVSNARRELSGGTSKGLMNYLTRQRRDRRFDGHVQRALRDGTPIPADMQRRMVGRYSDRLLDLRGETIARTETLNSMRAGGHEAFDQAMGVAGLPPDAMEREWDDTGDGRTREDHRNADGQRVGKDEPFVVGGERLMYPGDASLGASAKQTARCRCVEIHRVDWSRAAN